MEKIIIYTSNKLSLYKATKAVAKVLGETCRGDEGGLYQLWGSYVVITKNKESLTARVYPGRFDGK